MLQFSNNLMTRVLPRCLALRCRDWLPVIAWVILLFAAAVGVAADLPMRGYYLESFSAERGLPQNTVNALLQTRDGYLWIVTPFGLARFDGVTFKTFTAGNTRGLRDDMFTSLAEDRDGVLWAGTRDGLLRYEGGMFERLERAHGLPDNRVDALWPSREGGVWAGTREGVAYVRGRKATGITTNHGVASVFEDSGRRVWFSIYHGLYYLEPATRQPETVMIDRVKPFGARATCFWEDRTGAIWFGTPSGLHRWQNGAMEHFPRYGQELPLRMQSSKEVHCIIGAGESGGLWVGLGGEEGLHQFKDGEWSKAGDGNWPALRRARRCLEDTEGNLWLGTDTHGLLRLRRPRLQTFGRQDGLLHDCVWSVCSSREGGVWVGGDEGFARIDERGVTPFRPPEHWSEAVIRSILEDRTGQLWVGDHAYGVYRFQNGSFRRMPMRGPMKALYEDRSGIIWAGTSEGMARIKNNEVKYYTTADGLSYRDVRAFLEDRDGTLWIGTFGGGVNLFSNQTFRVLSGFSSRRVWSFHEDSDGVMWVGTESGLNRYERGRVFVFTRKHGLFDDLVNHVVEDDAGMFWISCNRGIYRVSRKELNDVAGGRAASVNHVAYGEADGMISSETNGEHQPAGCKTADGRIWFPTQRGVVVIDPRTVYRNESPPPVIIEQVLANDKIVFGRPAEVRPARVGERASASNAAAPIRLPPGGAQVLEIHYTANSFVDPSKVQFKHQLIGYDADWRGAGTRRLAYYTNLRPGKYEFRVIACNNHGYWNERGAHFAFSVRPHFYQTWPFYGLCALGVLSCAAGVQTYRLRVQRRMLELEQQALLQRERARIAQDMHDDLGANLTKIAILSEVAKSKAGDAEQVRSTAHIISEMARKVIDNISEIVWLTNPRNDSLDNLASYLRGYAAEYFDATAVRCRIDFPAEVPAWPITGEARRDVLLVLKEALNNVVKHSGAADVAVTLHIEANGDGTSRLMISVSDNGQGLPLDEPEITNNGLRNMRERLSKRGGNVSIESWPGRGTKVKLMLNLRAENRPAPSTTFV